MKLAWNPSPDSNVIGYFVYYGPASGVYTNRLDAGNVASTTVGGLQTNVTYYFTVVGYDDSGDESPPSNEIAYLVPANLPVASAPTLGIQFLGNGGTNTVVYLISFQGNASATYDLQATPDFQRWDTIWITNCISDGLMVIPITDTANFPSRFYRLLRE